MVAIIGLGSIAFLLCIILLVRGSGRSGNTPVPQAKRSGTENPRATEIN